jgi:hypothetical protein
MSDRVATPIKAIRLTCLDCSGGSRLGVRQCPLVDCPLHEYRFGKRPASSRRTPLKAIRAYVRDFLCLGSALEAREWPTLVHPLWLYRLGRRPKASEVSRHLAAFSESGSGSAVRPPGPSAKDRRKAA